MFSKRGVSAKNVLVANSNQVATNHKRQHDDEFGMLTRMNSTKIDEKENHDWRQNQSADTENINDSISNLTNISMASYMPSMIETTLSSRAYSPPKQPRHGDGGTNNKRMRSKSRSPSPSNFIEIDKLQLYSPKRDRSDGSVESVKTNCTNKRSDECRQFALDQRSPVNRSKFSLPNFGLQTVRSMSHSPNGAVALIARSSSQCSTNSEFSQNDGKFPLKSSKPELTWECVKLRKSIMKSFIIKNTAEKKLSLKVEVVGPGFQIVSGTDKESIILQGNECRTISITFCPTVIGKAIGEVIFKPPKNWPNDTKRVVNLFGYGGSTALQLQGIERPPIGIAFLKMGETTDIRSTTLQRSFSIYNKGPLNGIATIYVKTKTNQYINENHINIEPSKCVIRPDDSINVLVTYKLRRKDLEKLSQKSCDVLTVATLEVLIGSEPNRQRIASLVTRGDDVPTKYNQLDFLVHNFPVGNRENFDDFNESIGNVYDLFSCFKTTEVALTINRTMLDESRDTCENLSDMEETVLFRTLIENPKSAKKPQALLDRMWCINPKRLTMDMMANSRKTFTIQSGFNKEQIFKIEASHSNLFLFSATSGRIGSDDECKIDVKLNSNAAVPSEASIIIYIESDCIEIPVFIQQTPYSYNRAN